MGKSHKLHAEQLRRKRVVIVPCSHCSDNGIDGWLWVHVDGNLNWTAHSTSCMSYPEARAHKAKMMKWWKKMAREELRK